MSISINHLKRAVTLAEQIESLKAELAALLGGSASLVESGGNGEIPAPFKKRGRKKRHFSAAGRARIVAAQKARWAKVKGEEAPAKAAKRGRKRGKLSAAGRAAIIAAQKKRWAKVNS